MTRVVNASSSNPLNVTNTATIDCRSSMTELIIDFTEKNLPSLRLRNLVIDEGTSSTAYEDSEEKQ